MNKEERNAHLAYIKGTRERIARMKNIIHELGDSSPEIVEKTKTRVKNMEEKITQTLKELGVTLHS